MKLLIDAQLPSKLCEILEQLDIDSIHVDQLPKGDGTPDLEISDYADKHKLTVLTKDFDFYHSHISLIKPNSYFSQQQATLKIGNFSTCFVTTFC